MGKKKLNLTENARIVLEKRYLAKDVEGGIIETPENMLERVSKAVAEAEKKYGGDVEKRTEEFYNLMADLKFMPNSPTLMNAGRDLGQLSACFVLPVEDSMEGIFDSIKSAALIHKSGGGTGFSFSRLRPRGATVKSTGGVASGPISFMKVFNSATEAVKQGGCVEENTRIATEHGLIKIKEWGPSDAPDDTWHKFEKPLKVYTDEGLKESDEFYVHGMALVRKIITKCGYSICTTLNHRLRVIDENGRYIWKYAKDIKKGDWVALQKNTYPEHTAYRLPEFELKPHFNAKEISLPKEATAELGEFIGYLIGDGCFSFNSRGTGRVIFSISDDEPEVYERIINLGKKLFGLEPQVSRKPGDRSANLFYNSTVLAHFLRHIGVDKVSSMDIRVPEIAFRAGRNFACGFLRGLFSADGSVRKDGYVVLYSVSEELIKQVQELLLSLGIPSKIHVNYNREQAFGKNPVYKLNVITIEGHELFKEHIGFFSKEKNDRLYAMKDIAWEFNDIIPNQEKVFAQIYDGPGRGCGPGRTPLGANRHLYRDIQHYLPGVTAPRNLTRSRLKSLAEKYDEIAKSPLKWFLENNQFYDRVAEIEEDEAFTLDLSVPDNNTYIAAGFVSHNTRRGANMGILRVDHPDILEFIQCKKNDKDITNFNISVAITDKFMEALKKDENYELIDPHTGKVTGTLKAREVFDLIVDMAWNNGEPGIIFIDRMNEKNPTPEAGEIESTNPCGEQPLLPYESCFASDTRIMTDKGWETVEEAYERQSRGELVSVYTDGLITNETGLTLRPATVVPIGERDIVTVELQNGQRLRVTPDHKVLTQRGWVTADSLTEKDFVCLMERQRSRVKSVTPAGRAYVYDVSEPVTHSLIAEGMIVHNCNLGSINLAKFVKTGDEGQKEIDFEGLKYAVHTAVRFLDDVIDVNRYPLPEIEKMTLANRKIGLGVMGFADMLIELGIPYNSDKAVEIAEKVMGFIQEESKKASEELAKERGTFPNWEKSIYGPGGISPGGRKLRNATTTTIAPTGTISIIAGASSGIEPLFALAFERHVLDNQRLVEVHPIFEEEMKKRGLYSRELMEKVAAAGSLKEIEELPEDVKKIYVTAHDILPEWHIKIQAAFQKYTDNAVSKTVNFPHSATREDVKNVYLLAYELGCKGVTIYRDGSREEQVLNKGAVKTDNQAHAQNPEMNPAGGGLSGGDGKQVRAGKAGGVSAVTQPKEDSGASGGKSGEETGLYGPYCETCEYRREIKPRPRPGITYGNTEKVKIGCGNLYITVNSDENGICEVFTNLGRAGGCPSQSEATSRLISLALRSGINVKSIVEQLKGIRCHSTLRQMAHNKEIKVLSCPDAIGKAIERSIGKKLVPNGSSIEIIDKTYIENDDANDNNDRQPGPDYDETACSGEDCICGDLSPHKKNGADCPECGSPLEHESGCVMCRSCGYSKCG